MDGRRRQGRVEHTDEWEQIELLCARSEQRDYELIRPLVHFGDPVAQRAEVTGTSERTLYHRTSAFLSVLYRAVERYGAPEALVTDGGSVFRANQARAAS